MENIIDELRNFSDFSRVSVNLITVFGFVLAFIYFVKFLAEVYKGFRLYIWSQFCSKTNLRDKYGQWIVISGATDGIGLSMAREFARRGFSIIAIGRNEEKLARTKVSLEEEANVGQVITVKIDLADSSLENFARIRAEIDPDNRDIGILINNAGYSHQKFQRFYRVDVESLQTTMNVNILATVYLTRMILPGMAEREKGLIVNLSSLSGYYFMPSPYYNIYGQTKKFVTAFSENLRIECAARNIDVVNLCPGFVDTSLSEAYQARATAIARPSIATPDKYAKSAINALSSGYSCYSGLMIHALYVKLFKTFDLFGILSFMVLDNLKPHLREYVEESPIIRRKTQSNTLPT